MASEKTHIIFVRALFFSFSLALMLIWGTNASAQGVRVETLSENLEASAGFTLKDKATTIIATPWGPKPIYDPAKDQRAKAAFKSLYEFVNQDDYFKGRPSSLYERSKRDLKRRTSISNRKDVRYLAVAKNQSLLALQNSGCSFVATRNCTDLDVILNPAHKCRFKDRTEYPFLTEMIGDPMHGEGDVDKQFEMYFENACNVWEFKGE